MLLGWSNQMGRKMRVNTRVLSLTVAGALLAGVFLFLGIREIGKPDEKTASPVVSAAPLRDTIVARAARAIEVGETITGDMVVNVPYDPARDASVATPAELIGKVAIRPIPANALVNRSWVDLQSNLAIRVPLGKRAVSIDTNSEIAVAGLLRPGNKVDVQVVYPGADAIAGTRLEGRSRTETILQAVQVLAVGESVLGAEAKGGLASDPATPARTVTLALTPDEVAVFSLAKNTGVLLLSLRNPDDDGFTIPLELASEFVPRAEPAYAVGPPPAAPRRPIPPRAPRRSAEPAGKAELIIAGQRKTLEAENK